MEETTKACADYIVNLRSHSLLCRCGFPKSEHGESPTNKRRTLIHSLSFVARGESSHQACKAYIVDEKSELKHCRCGHSYGEHACSSLSSTSRDGKLWRPQSESRDHDTVPEACIDFIIDVRFNGKMCRCGYPRSAHTDPDRISPTSRTMALKRSLSNKLDDSCGPRSHATELSGCVTSALDKFESISQQHQEYQQNEEAWMTKRLHNASLRPERCAKVPALVLETELGEASQTDCFTRHSSEELADFQNVLTMWSKAIDIGRPAAQSDVGVLDTPDTTCESEMSINSSRSQSTLELQQSFERSPVSEARSSDLEPPHEQVKRHDHKGPHDDSLELGFGALLSRKAHTAMIPDRGSNEDRTPPAAEAQLEAVQAVRARWTQAAQEAQERAAEERASAEARAAARHAKEVEAAAVARRRDEAQSAKTRAKEQRRLEDEHNRAQDLEARCKVAAQQQHSEQQEQKRLRKAREREEEALHQADMSESVAREKAAKIAEMRTVTILCGCGGSLSITPEELQTLSKYVPKFENKSAAELEELLPSLHMGAWLQGSKHLFN